MPILAPFTPNEYPIPDFERFIRSGPNLTDLRRYQPIPTVPELTERRVCTLLEMSELVKSRFNEAAVCKSPIRLLYTGFPLTFPYLYGKHV